MIEWRDAWSLLTLALVPGSVAFFVWAATRRARALHAFVETSLLPVVSPDVDPGRRRARAGLQVAVVGLLALALGGPMWGFHWEEVHREGIDLVFAIDTSRSMLATDVKPTRLARARLAIEDLVGRLGGDRVALVAFAGTAFVQCPLTLDYGAFAQSLQAIEVGIIPRGGTSLTAAIDTGLSAFEGHEGRHQALVLITDGEDHEGKVSEAVARAKERGVTIFTVGIGTTEGELVPADGGGYAKDRSGNVIKSRLDEHGLEEIAVGTGGVYLHAAGPSMGLDELYSDHIAKLDKRELGSTLERRFEQRYQIPLGVAFVLLAVEALIGDGRRGARVSWPWRRAIAAVVLAWLGIGWTWLDPHATAREGNRLYTAGKFDDAAERFNAALVDEPDSALLHGNLAAARYREGKYDEAVAALGLVPRDEKDPARAARVAYNLGNAKYRIGQAAEAADPQKALGLYAESLVAYRQALGLDPDDRDAKFNHEFVEKKAAELKKRLEDEQKKKDEQQQQDQQKPQDQQQDQPPQDQAEKKQQEQQQSDQQQAPEQKGQDQPQQAQKPDQQKPGAPQPQAGDQRDREPKPQSAGSAATGKPSDEHMSPEEAAALLDAERGNEVRPDEITKRLEGAVVDEPAEDW